MRRLMMFSALLVGFLAMGTAHAQKTAAIPNLKFSDFIPIAPIEFYDNIEVASKGQVEHKYIKMMEKEEILRYLTNETVLVSVAQIDKEGNMKYIPSRVSLNKTQYIVTMDYLKFATIEIRQQGDIVGEAVVGIGFRIILNLSSRANDINLGDIFAIGMAASQKKVYGSLRVEAIGLHDPEISHVIPLPSEISGASIQSIMQAITTIKYKIYDKTTNLAPQIAAMRASKEGISLPELREVVLRYHLMGKKVAPLKSDEKKPEENK